VAGPDDEIRKPVPIQVSGKFKLASIVGADRHRCFALLEVARSLIEPLSMVSDDLAKGNATESLDILPVYDSNSGARFLA